MKLLDFESLQIEPKETLEINIQKKQLIKSTIKKHCELKIDQDYKQNENSKKCL